MTKTFNGGGAGTADKIRIDAKCDQYAVSDPSSWELYNSSNVKIAESGTLIASGTKQTTVSLPAGTDCYRIKLIDDFGDSWGSGSSVKVYNTTGGGAVLMHTISATSFGDQLYGAIEITSTGNALAIEELETMNLNVYPNPANDVVNVSFEATEGDYAVVIMDLQGRQVTSEYHNTSKGVQVISIPVTDLAKGSYLVSISTASGIVTKNVMIK